LPALRVGEAVVKVRLVNSDHIFFFVIVKSKCSAKVLHENVLNAFSCAVSSSSQMNVAIKFHFEHVRDFDCRCGTFRKIPAYREAGMPLRLSKVFNSGTF
jgi:hypothetical protein